MDFGNATMLMAALAGLTQLAKTAWKGTKEQRITVALVVVLSILAVFLLAASVWAHEQVLGGHPLDSLDFGSKLVVALFLSGAASALWEGYSALKNIGSNQPTKLQAAAYDVAASRVITSNPAAATIGEQIRAAASRPMTDDEIAAGAAAAAERASGR